MVDELLGGGVVFTAGTDGRDLWIFSGDIVDRGAEIEERSKATMCSALADAAVPKDREKITLGD
jgi:hypothetical protein